MVLLQLTLTNKKINFRPQKNKYWGCYSLSNKKKIKNSLDAAKPTRPDNTSVKVVKNVSKDNWIIIINQYNTINNELRDSFSDSAKTASVI